MRPPRLSNQHLAGAAAAGMRRFRRPGHVGPAPGARDSALGVPVQAAGQR